MATTVLIVDDHQSFRRAVRLVLEYEGYEVVGEAADGEEALRVAGETSPNVVLLDVNMPGMDGIAALPHLRREAPDARILMLTAADEPDTQQRAEEAGAHGFMRKPNDVLDLPGMIRERLAAAA